MESKRPQLLEEEKKKKVARTGLGASSYGKASRVFSTSPVTAAQPTSCRELHGAEKGWIPSSAGLHLHADMGPIQPHLADTAVTATDAGGSMYSVINH